LLLICSLK